MEEVRTRVQALLPTIIEQRVLGEAVVQQLFDIKGKGKSVIKIAGCKVTNGVIEKSKMVRVLRDGEEIFSGTSLLVPRDDLIFEPFAFLFSRLP